MGLAIGLWVAPGLFLLAKRYWTTSQGAQGPIILATGLWTLHYELSRSTLRRRDGSIVAAVAALIAATLVYIVARMVGMLSLELLAAGAALLAILYAYVGWRMIQRLAVPLAYLLCIIPLPYFLESTLTGELKLRIASWSVDLLSLLGLDVANNGNSLYVDQYELYLEAACSGLNSIFSLTAIGLLYVHWQRRRQWRQALLLGALIVPLAIVANLLRVVGILVMVHWWGAGILAGMLHPAMGFAMFVLALGLLIAIDTAIGRRLPPVRASEG